MNHKKIALLSLPIIALLSGCGGGGGGGSSLTQITFSDWDSITKPSQVNLEGLSVDFSYTAGSKVSTITDKGVDSTTTASVNYRTNDTISKISFTSQNGTVTFNEDGTDTIGDTGTTVYGYNQAGSNFLLAANPLNSSVDWNYQTFGIWETGRGTGSGTAGGISVGAATDGSSIPTSGTATYSGYFGGALVDYDGDDFITRGRVSLGADFTNRTLTFATTSTDYLSPVATTPTWRSDSSLNISNVAGTKLSWSAATNSFTGNVVDGNSLSGTVTGKFYGPAAEEVGGIYNISGSGLNRHAGAFGAKR